MSLIRCLILDDEYLAQDLLRSYVERVPFLSLTAVCKNPLEALAVLQREVIDLLFLDIQMPELTGLDMLRTLHTRPLVIFTTAYAQYALDGFNVDAVDYLLKPFPFERFLVSVNKAADRYRIRQLPAPELPAGVLPDTPARSHLLVKAEHKVYRLEYADIQYIQARGEYAVFHTPQGRVMSIVSLKKLETELPASFVRVHKSYIVHLRRIRSIEGNVLHLDGADVPVGLNFKDKLLESLR
ncbi:MAG: response regulator transcription factor [Bacteroidia bacterium]|nr:response regulator transcription factor [Bacteroidia bacterium]